VILPRKAVLELQRILGTEGQHRARHRDQSRSGPDRRNSLHIEADRWTFPGVRPCHPGRPTKIIDAEREGLRQALQRTAILSNEKYRGVRVSVKPDLMMIQAHNPEQEEAEDEVEVNYKGDEVEIGFNVNYLLDALSAIDTDRVEIGLTDANSSCLIRAPGTTNTKYVVMPMRL
jgi:DNA polymerase-3 subunit beta